MYAATTELVTTRSLAVLLSRLVLVLPLALVECVSHTCTDIGCGAVATADLTLAAGTPAGAEVTVCRGGVCSVAPLPAAVTEPNQGMFAAFAAPSEATAWFWMNADRSFLLVVSWAYVVNPKDGDAFSVTVKDASGATLASFDRTATYTSRPREINEPGCGTCYAATLGPAP
jgi:hypothetical protein